MQVSENEAKTRRERIRRGKMIRFTIITRYRTEIRARLHRAASKRQPRVFTDSEASIKSLLAAALKHSVVSETLGVMNSLKSTVVFLHSLDGVRCHCVRCRSWLLVVVLKRFREQHTDQHFETNQVFLVIYSKGNRQLSSAPKHYNLLRLKQL